MAEACTGRAQAAVLSLPAAASSNFELTSPLTDLTWKGAPDLVQWAEHCQVVFVSSFPFRITSSNTHHPLLRPRPTAVTPPHEGCQCPITRLYLTLQPFKFKAVNMPHAQGGVVRQARGAVLGRLVGCCTSLSNHISPLFQWLCDVGWEAV